MRINVVGSSASGKSTFSKQLAHAMNSPYVELDSLYWLADWGEKIDEEFYQEIKQATSAPRWILDGNYHRSHPIKWKNADLVVWLDYSRIRILWRSVSRAVKRSASGEELWPGTGNRETFRKSFFSKESVIWWSISNYSKIRRRYLDIMSDPQFSHLKFVQIKSPAEARQFIYMHTQ